MHLTLLLSLSYLFNPCLTSVIYLLIKHQLLTVNWLLQTKYRYILLLLLSFFFFLKVIFRRDIINVTSHYIIPLYNTRYVWLLPSPFPPPSPIIMEAFDLKICQNFVGTKFFLTFVGGKPIWGSNIYYYTFIISFL